MNKIFALKVSKPQKHFFLKLHCPQTIEILDKILVMQQTVPDHNLSYFINCRSIWYLNLPNFEIVGKF